jgi:hypothetical protein
MLRYFPQYPEASNKFDVMHRPGQAAVFAKAPPSQL